MSALMAGLDRKRNGTHYADRMQRILGVCHDCGLLWHEERVTYRNGASELKRVDDIQSAQSVLVTPQYEKYGLRVNPRVLPRLKAMASQFAYALNVSQTHVEVDGNIVYVRVPRAEGADDNVVPFEKAWRIAPGIPRGSLLLGVDEDQEQLVLELTSPTNVHAAVIGMTGSGKSTLMRTMILAAQLIGGARVALFDPSKGFLPLSGHPSVWRGGLFSDPEDCELGLEALANSIGRADGGLTFVFVDEVPELITRRPRIKEYLARLAQAGRHAGIHLILGAQHPLASELGPTTMRNIPVRLVARVADRSAAYNATGRSDTGAEHLRGKGDFIVVNGSTVRHFQAAFTSPKLLAEWSKRYPPREPRVPVRSVAQHGAVGGATSPSFGNLGRRGGRPQDDIPEEVVGEIQSYVREHGSAPSSNWVYRRTRDLMPAGGFNRDKTRRALQAALEPLAAMALEVTVPPGPGRWAVEGGGMTRSLAKGVFLAILAVAAAVLALAVYQVPQPWRGFLVGWLLFLGSVGAVALRLARHYYSYKSLQLTAKRPLRGNGPTRRARKATNAPHVSRLKVVRAGTGAGGRHTIR